MSTTFALKGHAGTIYHGAHSRTPLEIRGHFHIQGPQPVGDGGVPKWVSDAFDAMPHMTRIALSSKTGGVVWSRIEEAA